MEFNGASLRAKMKEKAHRIANCSDDAGESDSSSRPKDNDMDGGTQTGMRPLGRQNRATGGLVKELVNSNVKEANEDRPGKKHIDGMKRGGMTDSDDHPKGCRCKACGGAVSVGGVSSGGRDEKAGGGSLAPKTSIRPKPRDDVDSLAPKTSIRPKPRPDSVETVDVGSSEPDGMKSGGSASKEDRKGRKAGGRTNINIIIQQPKSGLGAAGMHPMMPPPEMNPPMPPPMMPPPGAGAPPPMMPHPSGSGIGPMLGGGMPPMMGRASGGAVNKDIHMTHGAGGGLGRLEKTRKYGNNAKSGEAK